MKHYYFDLRDGEALAPDEEGIDLPNIEAVQEEAAKCLADMAKDSVRRGATNPSRHGVAIEVRDSDGPVLQAKLTFEVERQKH
jgi:hypothetical protein